MNKNLRIFLVKKIVDTIPQAKTITEGASVNGLTVAICARARLNLGSRSGWLWKFKAIIAASTFVKHAVIGASCAASRTAIIAQANVQLTAVNTVE